MKFKYILLTLLTICSLGANAKKEIVSDGVHLVHRKDGTLKEKTFYKNGVLHGTKYHYFKDGKTVKHSIDYMDGEKKGIERYYGKLGLLRDFKVN